MQCITGVANFFSESSEADGQNNAASAERQQSEEASQTFDSASDASHDDDPADLLTDSSKPKIIGLFDLASELLLGWKSLKVGIEIPTNGYCMLIVVLL